MRCPRPPLLLRLSPPNTWRAFQGTAVRPPWRSLVATLRVLGVTSWGSFHPSACALVTGVACLRVRGLLALRAAVLRLAVSLLAPPEYGRSFLSLRASGAVVVAKSGGVFALAGSGPCQRVMPNPSIERTNNGGSQLRVSASAQPPLFASHLKRWASR
jgi:hypothetical protein